MMKKFLRTFVSVLLVLTLALSVAACKKGKDPGPEGPGENPPAVAELNVSAALALDLYEFKQMEAKDKNGAVVNATWTTADANVATVTESGLVTAKSTGSTKLTASYNGNTAECTVTVRDSGARPHLSVVSNTKTLVVGAQTSLTPVVTYQNQAVAATLQVTGGNDEVATYTVENGVITFTGEALGSMEIEISGQYGSWILTPVKVTVSVVEKTSLVYADGDLSLCTIDFGGLKKEHPVSLDVYDDEGNMVANPVITWDSTDADVAEYVDGKIVAKGKEGTATIRATYNTVYVEFDVTVVRAKDTIASGLSLSDSYKKVDLSFLFDAGYITDVSEIESIYDESNGKTLTYTLDGNVATLTNYTGSVGYMNWVFNTSQVAVRTEVAHATHRLETLQDWIKLGQDWETATLGNVQQTILFNNGTNDWLVALANDFDFLGVTTDLTKDILFGSNYASDATLSDLGWSDPNFDPRLAVFNGIFDGRGYAIKNAKFTNGFITNLGDPGVIRNLALINCSPNGGGGILGNYGRGTVENCYISGSLGASGSQAAAYFYTSGKMMKAKSTIFNVSSTSTAICLVTTQAGAANEPYVENVFAVSTSVSKIWSGDATNGGGVIFQSAASFAGGVIELPASYNGYWNMTSNALYFGDEEVMTW